MQPRENQKTHPYLFKNPVIILAEQDNLILINGALGWMTAVGASSTGRYTGANLLITIIPNYRRAFTFIFDRARTAEEN